ncbi:cytochrome d ubiquinol oxidase subunit I [Nocardioides ginsengisegetis]|uniref:Cytochrome d ubiquinol oxidase subunit I n=1 Tax=Nocardioides ginsengisegetis TaxID=661491 RepID=A0A7W3IZG1_9ACTN|nr:cytochrome ubiquinol oxidase subunit I [Nocardioides ginsengisegetis]MBA8803448.1 cytochrome d ubiquinol oxidase subunit I [Nocardioides ginsengisegetis]
MDPLDIARWQFGIVTVYHFLFVPITIGLSAIVAGYETAWVRTGHEHWLRLTKFFGKLFLINFAIGVVTGIVQEFQFGMNWSDYSRFVGDIFGAPLAIEGLLAFFLESTFLGLWIFGWDRLPARVHAACIWIVHVGTLLSAYFILAANSWMQHPVGYRFNPDTGRAELHDFAAVLLNKVQLATFPHVVLSAYLTGAGFVVGVAFWSMRRTRDEEDDRRMYLRAVRTGAAVALVAALGVVVSGDVQGKIMTDVQPMKMAAAEGLYDTTDHAPFSLLTIGKLDGSTATNIIEMPGLLSFLGTGHFDGEVQGINQLRAEYRRTYGTDPGAAYYSPGDYTPIVPVTYWSFRLMIGLGLLAAAGAALILLATRRGRAPTGRFWLWLAIAMPLLPVAANSFGWIFTEMGRQPWAVFGLMTTAQAVSPGVGAGTVLTSLLAFTVVYAVLAVIEVRLVLTYIRAGAEPLPEPVGPDDTDRPLAFAY